MIVDPDFLDHWRTRMLVDMLEDELAPMYIIRLWGHCQNRREWVFDGMPIQATKAICRYQGDSEVLEKALIDCGFLSREGDEITIVGWDEHNASLIANWTNGKRGGRPKGSTKETRKKPMGKPSENPVDNPSETDKIGCDEIGEEETPVVPKGDRVPYKEIFDLYHELLPELPPAPNQTEKRKRNIAQRWKETAKVPAKGGFQEFPCNDLGFWERFFSRVRNSPHLMGENERGWQANLEWITKKENFYKIIEGNYVK